MQKSAFYPNPSPTFGYDPENKKSPDFETQSGLLFEMSPIMGIRASVIPAHLHDNGICNPFQ
jgi:hypothetical protein